MVFRSGNSNIPIAALGTVGLIAVVVWADLLGHWPGFATPLTKVQPLGNARMFFLMGYTATAMVTAFISRLSKRSVTFFRIVLPSIACTGTLLFGFAYNQDVVPPEALAIVGLAACGIGYYGITLFLYCELAKLDRLSNSLWAIAASLFLKTIIGDAIGYASSSTAQVALAAVLPCISLACYALMKAMGTDKHLKQHRAHRTLSKPEVRNLVYLLVAVSVILAAFRGSGHLGLWGEGHFGSPIASVKEYALVGISFAAFAYLALIRNCNDRMLVRYQPAFLVIFGGFLIYVLQGSLFPDDAGKLPISWLLVSVELFGHLTSWGIVLTGIRTTHAPLWRFQAISDVSYGIFAIAWALLIQNTAISVQILVCAMAFLSMVAAIRPLSKKPIETENDYAPFSQGQKRREAWIAAEVSNPDNETQELPNIGESMARCYRSLANTGGLSPRETEVFMLLAQGRSRPYICNELFISDGTVKTHISHIYKKFDVHTREEMLTIVQEAVAHWETGDRNTDR